MGSTFKSWADFRKWYAEAVKGFTTPDEQVKRLAAEVTKGKTTRDQKLKGQLTGLLGFQMHVGAPMTVEFRNIWLKSL